MTTLHALLERRAAIAADRVKIKEQLHEMNANGSPDEARWASLTNEDVKLAKDDARLAQLEAMEHAGREAERRMQGQPIGGTGDRHFDRETRSASVLPALALQMPGSGVDGGHAREVSQEIARRSGLTPQGLFVPLLALAPQPERRAMTVGNDVSAGYLVGTDVRPDQLVDPLRPKLVTAALGARVLADVRGDIRVPKQTGGAVAAWVSENTALDPSDLEFGAVHLRPRSVGALTEFSRQLLLQSSADVEALVRADLTRVLAGAVDKAVIAGSGVGPEPLGILNHDGIGIVAIGDNGGPISADKVRDLVGAVETADADAGGVSFLTNPRVRAAALKLKDGEGKYLGLDTVFPGAPLAVTSNVPHTLTKGSSAGNCSAVIYGAWDSVILAYWGAVDLLVNPYESEAYKRGAVMVRAMMSCDVALRNEQSFAVIKDVTTA